MNLSSAALPRFYSYAQVLAHYDKVVPLRSGSAKGDRPLGDRRYKYCQIHKHDETDAITLELYGQDVITWFPNDIVHFSLCGWDTVSTRQFMYSLTPYSTEHDRGTTYLCIGPNKYPFETAQATLEVDMKTNTVLNPTQEYAYTVDRKKLKEVKQRYGGFREYVAQMGKVLVGIKSTDFEAFDGRVSRVMLPLASNYRFHGKENVRQRLSDFCAEIKQAQETEDLETYYKLFLQLGASCLYYHSRLEMWVRSWADHDIEIGEPMVTYLDEIIKFECRDEVFVKTAVPIGSKVSNKNRQYFE